MVPIVFSRPDFGEEEAQAAAEAVRSGWVVGGPRLAAFETRFAELGGARHAVGVSSWTTGAFLVLHAWGLGPGDEVIVPSLTFIASVNVVRHVGAQPVFVDIDPRTFNIDPDQIEPLISPHTKAIIAVDQLGLPCDMDRIQSIARRHDLKVLDDAACALGGHNQGRPVGSLAEVSVFSLHARKIVTTGEGGMILTDDDALAERLRRLRHQGMSLSDYARHGASPTLFETYPEVGFNCRITDVQAAVGTVQLKRLEYMLARRQAIAETYNAALAGHPFLSPPHVPEGITHSWQSYQVTLRNEAPLSRNQLMERLWARGIPTRRGVMASHLEEAHFEHRVHLPQTERIAASTFQLPMHSGLTPNQQHQVLAELTDIM